MAEMLDVSEDLHDQRLHVDVVVARIRRFQVHQLNRNRAVTGEYHHLFPMIKQFRDKFVSYTTMELDTFEYVLSGIKPFLEKNWCNFHTQPILPEHRLVITLRFLATGLAYKDLAFSFSMGSSTVNDIVKETMYAIWIVFHPRHMPLLTKEDYLKVSDDFYTERGFPHCLGAIDCKHIAIKQPPHTKTKYYNYKKFYSVKLQAVVDADYKFISIDVGSPGSEHDAKTLKRSSFYKALELGIIKLPDSAEMPHSPIIPPYYFIGDGAYPLMEMLLKPYRGKNLPGYQKKYNKSLSRARIVVECAFGIIAKKWKIYNMTMIYGPDTVEKIAKCTCILHNIIIDRERKNYRNIEVDQALAIRDNSGLEEGEVANNCIVGAAKELQHEVMRYIWCTAQ